MNQSTQHLTDLGGVQNVSSLTIEAIGQGRVNRVLYKNGNPNDTFRPVQSVMLPVEIIAGATRIEFEHAVSASQLVMLGVGLDTIKSIYLNAIKGRVLYVDDYTTLQACFNTASSGDTIIFGRAKTYGLDAQVILPTLTDITIAGNGSTLVAPGGLNAPVLIGSSIARWKWSDLTIDGSKASQSSATECLRLTDVDDFDFLRITFKDSYAAGLRLLYTGANENERNNLRWCTFTGCGGHAAELRGTSRLTVEHCTFESWGAVTAASDALQFQDVTDDVSVIDNTFTRGASTLFAIETTSGANSFDFVGNRLFGDYVGVSGYFYNSHFIDNKFLNPSSYQAQRNGYELLGHDLIVSDNIIANGQIAISSGTDPHSVVYDTHHVTIKDNIVTANGSGARAISLGGVAARNLSYIWIQRNKLSVPTGNDGIAIGLYGELVPSDRIYVRGNTLNGNASATGVRVFQTCTFCDISDNDILGFGSGIGLTATISTLIEQGNELTTCTDGYWTTVTPTNRRGLSHSYDVGVLNKAESDYVKWALRDISGSEAKVYLQKLIGAAIEGQLRILGNNIRIENAAGDTVYVRIDGSATELSFNYNQGANSLRWYGAGTTVLTELDSAGKIRVAGSQVVGTRETGWTNAMTGTANKAGAFDTASMTLENLAQRVKALQDALTTHGMIGV